MAGPQHPNTPSYPTMVAGRTGDGRLVAVDGSVWLYRKVPMAPVSEAKSGDRAIVAGVPIHSALEELAALITHHGNRRSLVKNSYREAHLLLVNVPTLYRPDPGPIQGYLAEQFPDTVIDSRILLFGVRLQSTVGSGGLRSAIESVAETFVSGGTPMSDYDRDFEQVDAALTRAGLHAITAADIRLANAWWNHGTFPDTPALFHADHMHIFNSATAVGLAEQLGADNCLEWPPIPGAHALTFASVQELDLPYVEAKETPAKWIIPLIQSGAVVVSIRAKVEPSRITREELRRQRKGYTDDLNSRFKEGKMDRSELDAKLQELGDVEGIYSDGSGPVTLVDTSILVGLDGYVPDLSQISTMQVRLNTMLYRQQQAWAETMLCSNVRANPNLHDLPATVIAYSGLPSLSTVGDREGALVGFTEGDRQPALLSPVAIAQEDTYPICVVAASSGAGKSLMLLWLADQYARMGRPVVIIDPKALTLNTRIPTPDGWRLNGELKVGDRVFDRYGRICNVTALSQTFEQPDLYAVRFDDGQVIEADSAHRWIVLDANARRRMTYAGVPATQAQGYLCDVTTASMVEDGTTRGSRFAVPLAGPVQYPAKKLKVDPYLLGAWLGDGASRSGTIFAGDQDVAAMTENIRSVWPHVTVRPDGSASAIICTRDQTACVHGHTDYVRVTRQWRCRTCSRLNNWAQSRRMRPDLGELTNAPLQTLLREIGVLGNKHIPSTYLTASTRQRLALLQGLMDTDGTVKNSGACRITLSNERLIIGVLELIRSLGIKATMSSGMAFITEDDPDNLGQRRRRQTSRAYMISFHTTEPVFRLQRKLDRMPKSVGRQASLHYITSIERIESAPARCIRVDSGDHTYLAAGYIPTHNTGSDHSAAVRASGGQVASLDDLLSADGVLDPLRFAVTTADGIEMATSMLLTVNPFGDRKLEFEVPLIAALNYGISKGATCIGQALQVAHTDGQGNTDMIRAVFDYAKASPMFRAMVGFDPQTTGLRISDGITLIKVGNAHLNLPSPGTVGPDLSQRTAIALVRMMIFGSATALTGRDGIILQDEAWTILNSDPKEVERLGRLARSQRVLPILFSQDISGAVRAGLKGFISRGFIGPIGDEVEAMAALDLFNVEATPERMARITASATTDSYGTDELAAPNWNSMKSLRDPRTREVLRGSIWLYSDLAGRVIPVEVVVPPAFLQIASTNAVDLDARAAV